MRTALEGVEVLDLGTLTPGKYCTFLLAELGASVLRVERPSSRPRAISTEDLILNRGKRSMTLDLRGEAGRDVLGRLAGRADVVIESSRPGVAERIGIDYERLRAHNARLVYCSLSGFGQEGPYRSRPAYDLIFMGMSGALQAFFGRGVPPSPPGIYLADTVSGLMAALGIGMALLARELDGAGRFLDLAMFDSIFSLLATSHGLIRDSGASAGDEAEAWSSPLYAVYATADRPVTLCAIRPASCEALFRELGRPELAERAWDPTAATEIRAFLEATLATATAEAWVERLSKLDVEIGAVLHAEEAFDDPQLRARGMVIETTHPEAGPSRQIGTPFGAGEPPRAPAPAPAVGAHTEEVLAELGFDARAIEALRSSGVI